jgi:hypothetical protein
MNNNYLSKINGSTLSSDDGIEEDYEKNVYLSDYDRISNTITINIANETSTLKIPLNLSQVQEWVTIEHKKDLANRKKLKEELKTKKLEELLQAWENWENKKDWFEMKKELDEERDLAIEMGEYDIGQNDDELNWYGNVIIDENYF